ncbi:uncharacterized protein LOC104919670 [Larimichthys crocea]|uniref:uncharacterized protein LOC104919670 n=1 Tax=Larimichthys crocea TaxID=215358 RepID=UPI000F6043B0|nr:uncharacterized protein LOC104919670 [Larimichthys crocea]
MKLLLSSMLLASLCALSSWSVSSGVPVVTQTPDVSVTEGETVNITCCWTVKFERMSVNWLKNQTVIKTELKYPNNSQASLQKERSGCSYFTFMNITREDSGRYTCRLSVEIPELRMYQGNGTVITVTARDNNNEDYNASGDGKVPATKALPVYITAPLAVVVPLLLITLVCFCALKRRQASSAARVIYEVPHTDSEEADMDKRSTSSSTGSSQWCQVPVYESFDYFERVQTKESG